MTAALIAASAACARSPVSPSQSGPALGAPPASQGDGAGNTPGQLSQAGWFCISIPEGVHCLAPGRDIGPSVAIPVKVFDTLDPASESAPFLGMESLIRADHYKGQPCLPGHGEYILLPFGYYACHHFEF